LKDCAEVLRWVRESRAGDLPIPQTLAYVTWSGPARNWLQCNPVKNDEFFHKSGMSRFGGVTS
jgi:hypothetical protein